MHHGTNVDFFADVRKSCEDMAPRTQPLPASPDLFWDSAAADLRSVLLKGKAPLRFQIARPGGIVFPSDTQRGGAWIAHDDTQIKQADGICGSVAAPVPTFVLRDIHAPYKQHVMPHTKILTGP